MGKKYIIELLDDCPSEFKGIIVFGLTPEGQIAAEPIPVEDLTPYTEPDMEQVRKEAYDKCMDEAEMSAYKLYSPKIDEAYQRGLNDAWEAARKICTNWVLPDSVLSKIFGMNKTIDDIMKESTASEAIEKIRTYEQAQKEKEEQIQVGDEVRNIHHGWTAVVSAIDRECMTLMDTNGELGDGYDVNRFTKTGRHFPEIAEVLQKMRES